MAHLKKEVRIAVEENIDSILKHPKSSERNFAGGKVAWVKSPPAPLYERGKFLSFVRGIEKREAGDSPPTP